MNITRMEVLNGLGLNVTDAAEKHWRTVMSIKPQTYGIRARLKCHRKVRGRKMEMSIKEHMTQLKKLKSFHNGSYGASINFAIDTMRKYQKIKRIIEVWHQDIYAKDFECIA